MVLKMPTLTLFMIWKNERLFGNYSTCGFIIQRNINMETFRTIGVQKLLENTEWIHTVFDIKGFIPSVVH